MIRVNPLIVALFLCLAAPFPAAAEPWRAPNFSLRDLSGKEHSLAAHKGKVVVLEFFASWCPNCATAVASLNALAKRYPGQLVVVAVSTGEDDPHDLPVFVEEHAPAFTVLVDDTDQVGRKYGVMGFPTYYVIDVHGMVRATREGTVEWEDPRNLKKLEETFGLTPPAAAPAAAPLPVTTVQAGPALR